MDAGDIKSVIDGGISKHKEALQNEQLVRTKMLLKRTQSLLHSFPEGWDPRVIPTLSKRKVASDVCLLNPRSFRALSQDFDKTHGKQHSSSLPSIGQTSKCT